MQRGEGVEVGIRDGVGAEQHVVEDVQLRVDGEVLAHLEGRLEAEAQVGVRLRVVAAGSDEWPGKQVVAGLVAPAAQVEIVEELAAQAQVAVGLEEVHPLLERLHRLAVLHAGCAVLLDPGGLLLHLVLRLLQFPADFFHHLAAELFRVQLRGRALAGGRRADGRVGRRGRGRPGGGGGGVLWSGSGAALAGLRRGRRLLRLARGRIRRRLGLALRRRLGGRGLRQPGGRQEQAESGERGGSTHAVPFDSSGERRRR